MTPSCIQNLLTQLSQIFGANNILVNVFLKYFKMANLALILELSLAKDEQTFSIVGTIKSEMRNKFTNHLMFIVQMFT